MKKIVHPVDVMFTSIRQCELVPATFPAIKMVFASNHPSPSPPTDIVHVHDGHVEELVRLFGEEARVTQR